jgi:hypothetical protein
MNDTFITPVREECEAKDRRNGSVQKELDEMAGNEVGAFTDRNVAARLFSWPFCAKTKSELLC